VSAPPEGRPPQEAHGGGDPLPPRQAGRLRLTSLPLLCFGAPLRRGLCRVLLLGEPATVGAAVCASPARGVEARRLTAQGSTGVADAGGRMRSCGRRRSTRLLGSGQAWGWG